MKKFNKKYFIGILIIVVFILQSILYFQSVVDDSYISYRYGYNLVKYGYWNYNPDNNYTEAYTSALYAFLSIIPPLINLDALIFFKFISVIVFSLFLITIYILRECFENKNKYLALAIILFNHAFLFHLYAGLETCLFVLLIFQLFLFLYFNKFLNWAIINIFLLPFVRPEGIVFSLAAMIYLIYYNSTRFNVKFLNIKVISMFVIWIIYFIWRYTYFKMLLPNPFYVKVMLKNINILKVILANFINGFYYFIIILLMFIFFKNKLFRIFLILSFLIFILIYAPSSLVMDFLARFKFQIFFPLILCFILINSHKKITNLVKYFIILIILSVSVYHYPSLIDSTLKWNYDLISKYKKIGKQLNTFKSDNYNLLIGEAGIIPYYSDLKVFDLFGLANTYIARNGVTKDYLDKNKIDIIMKYSFDENKELMSTLENYYIPIDTFYNPEWKVNFQFYIKKADLDNKTLEKIDKFKNELEKINHEEFNLYKYIKQEYIFE